MSLNLLNFISYFLSKKCFLSAWEILGFARFLARFLSFSLIMPKLQALWKFLSHDSFATNFFIAKQSRIDRTIRVIKQNIHSTLHSKNFKFY